MKFDDLVNSLLNEETLPYDGGVPIIDNYRGGREVVATLIGDENKSETIEGINGDGSDEFRFNRGLDAVIDLGTKIGLWKLSAEGNLEVIDSEKWNDFYDEVVMDESSEENSEYEHRGWPGDGSSEDDFADYNQMEGDDY